MKKSIFIVEDESIIALMLQRFLSAKNYSILGIAKDGEKAIELVRALKPDLIIIDVNIQGNINGVDTYKKIKLFHNVPVIFLTGGLVEVINNDKQCNGTPIFSKPVSMEDLKKTIDRLLV